MSKFVDTANWRKFAELHKISAKLISIIEIEFSHRILPLLVTAVFAEKVAISTRVIGHSKEGKVSGAFFESEQSGFSRSLAN